MYARKSKHTFERNGQNLLKTSLIYGPNASGKSSLLNAFTLFRNGVINSANNPENSALPYEPYMLGNQENKPTFFEAIFSLEDQIFRYNFSFLKDKIVAENLFEISISGKEKQHFKRSGQDIDVFYQFKKSRDVAEVKTRKEVLFLSAASQWNNELAIKIINGLKNINVISGLHSGNYGGYTIRLCKEEQSKKEILELLRKADFSINGIEVRKMSLPEPIIKQMLAMGAKEIPKEADTVFFTHDKYDVKGTKIGITEFNIGNESAGTQKFFEFLGPVWDTLKSGKVLFIDEFDNSLHSFLTKFIIDLFERKNPKKAQLVVTTHDTSLLAYEELNKEQFWFTEKDRVGNAKIFSLAEFDIRNDTEFAKKYLEGRFGALPFIDFGD